MMSLKRTHVVVGVLASALTFTAGPAAANGGFVAAGVTAAPDYEGGDDYVASPALFGRYNFSEGRYLALVGSADAARSGRLVFNFVPNSAWEMGPALGSVLRSMLSSALGASRR